METSASGQLGYAVGYYCIPLVIVCLWIRRWTRRVAERTLLRPTGAPAHLYFRLLLKMSWRFVLIFVLSLLFVRYSISSNPRQPEAVGGIGLLLFLFVCPSVLLISSWTQTKRKFEQAGARTAGEVQGGEPEPNAPRAILDSGRSDQTANARTTSISTWWKRLFTVVEIIVFLGSLALALILYNATGSGDSRWPLLLLLILPTSLVRLFQIALIYIVEGDDSLRQMKQTFRLSFRRFAWVGVAIVLLVGAVWVFQELRASAAMKDPDVVEGAGALLRQDGAGAVEAFTSASHKFPKNDQIFLWLGRGYGMLHDNDNARRNYQHAIELNPRNADAWMYLGMSLNENDPITAIEACKKATELQPRNASHWFILGLVYVGQDKSSLAVPALERAVQIKPDFAQAWSSLADAYSLTGDQKRSSEARRRAAELKTPNGSQPQKDNSLPPR